MKDRDEGNSRRDLQVQSLRGLRQLDSGKAPSMSKEGTGEPGSGQSYYATEWTNPEGTYMRGFSKLGYYQE